MKVVGLTGGSGAGKSAVSKIMYENGAGWVDADAVYRKLCDTHIEMLKELSDEFEGVLDSSRKLDRKKLAKLVFGAPQKLKRLNEICFPYIRDASLREIQAQSDRPFVIFDAPTLFENGADSICDDTIGVIADKDIRVKRITDRDGISEEAAKERINAQPDEAFYRKRCGHIIINNGNLESLRKQTDELYKELEGQELKR